METEVNMSNKEEVQKMYAEVNYVTKLMEIDKVESALDIIYKLYPRLEYGPKLMLTSNLLQARNQYDFSNVVMPEGFYNFLANEVQKRFRNTKLL